MRRSVVFFFFLVVSLPTVSLFFFTSPFPTCSKKTLWCSADLKSSTPSSSPVNRAHGQGRGHFHNTRHQLWKTNRRRRAHVTAYGTGSEHVTNTYLHVHRSLPPACLTFIWQQKYRFYTYINMELIDCSLICLTYSSIYFSIINLFIYLPAELQRWSNSALQQNLK